MSFADCADHLGIQIKAVAARCQALGINQKMNRGRLAAAVVMGGKSNG